jgi:hypothetical protein
MTCCIKVIIYDRCQKLNILNEEQKGCVNDRHGLGPETGPGIL